MKDDKDSIKYQTPRRLPDIGTPKSHLQKSRLGIQSEASQTPTKVGELTRNDGGKAKALGVRPDPVYSTPAKRVLSPTAADRNKEIVPVIMKQVRTLPPIPRKVEHVQLINSEDFHYEDYNARYKQSFAKDQYFLSDANVGGKKATTTPFDIKLQYPSFDDLCSTLYTTTVQLQPHKYLHSRFHKLSDKILNADKDQDFIKRSDDFFKKVSAKGLFEENQDKELDALEKIISSADISQTADYGSAIKAIKKIAENIPNPSQDAISKSLVLEKQELDMGSVALYLLRKTIQKQNIDLRIMPSSAVRVLLKTQLNLIIDLIKETVKKEQRDTPQLRELLLGQGLLEAHQSSLDSNLELKYAKLVWAAQKTAAPKGGGEMAFALLQPSSTPFKSKILLEGSPPRVKLEATIFSSAQRLALTEIETAILSSIEGKSGGRAIKINIETGGGKTYLLGIMQEFYSERINILRYDLNSNKEDLVKLHDLAGKSADGKDNFIFFDEVFFYGDQFAELALGSGSTDKIKPEDLEKHKAQFIKDLRSKGIIVALVGASENPEIVKLVIARNKRKMAEDYEKIIQLEDKVLRGDKPNEEETNEEETNEGETNEEEKNAARLVIKTTLESIKDRERKIEHIEKSVIKRMEERRRDATEKIESGEFLQIKAGDIGAYQDISSKIGEPDKKTLYVLPDVASMEGFSAQDFRKICGDSNEFFVVTPFKIDPATQKFKFKIWYKKSNGSVASQEAEEGNLAKTCESIELQHSIGNKKKRRNITLYDKRIFVGGDTDRLALNVGQLFMQFDPGTTKTADDALQIVGRARDKNKEQLKVHVFSSETKEIFLEKIDQNTQKRDELRMEAYLSTKASEKEELAREEIKLSSQNSKKLEFLKKEYEKGYEKRAEERVLFIKAQEEEEKNRRDLIEADLRMREAQILSELALQKDEVVSEEEKLRLQALEAQNLDLIRRRGEIEERERKLKDEIEERERKLKEKQDANTDIKSKIDDLQVDINDKQKAVEEKARVLAEQAAAEADYKAKLSALQAELKTLNAELGELNNQSRSKKEVDAKEEQELQLRKKGLTEEINKAKAISPKTPELAMEIELHKAQIDLLSKINESVDIIKNATAQVGLFPSAVEGLERLTQYLSDEIFLGNTQISKVIKDLESLNNNLQNNDFEPTLQDADQNLDKLMTAVEDAKKIEDFTDLNSEIDEARERAETLSRAVFNLLQDSNQKLQDGIKLIRQHGDLNFQVDNTQLKDLTADIAGLEQQKKLAAAAKLAADQDAAKARDVQLKAIEEAKIQQAALQKAQHDAELARAEAAKLRAHAEAIKQELLNAQQDTSSEDDKKRAEEELREAERVLKEDQAKKDRLEQEQKMAKALDEERARILAAEASIKEDMRLRIGAKDTLASSLQEALHKAVELSFNRDDSESRSSRKYIKMAQKIYGDDYINEERRFKGQENALFKSFEKAYTKIHQCIKNGKFDNELIDEIWNKETLAKSENAGEFALTISEKSAFIKVMMCHENSASFWDGRKIDNEEDKKEFLSDLNINTKCSSSSKGLRDVVVASLLIMKSLKVDIAVDFIENKTNENESEDIMKPSTATKIRTRVEQLKETAQENTRS